MRQYLPHVAEMSIPMKWPNLFSHPHPIKYPIIDHVCLWEVMVMVLVRMEMRLAR